MKKQFYTNVIFTIILISIVSFLISPRSHAYEVNVSGNSIQYQIQPNEEIEFDFFNFNNLFTISSNTSIEMYLEYDLAIVYREISIIVNTTKKISLNISCQFDTKGFLSQIPENPSIKDLILTFQYNCIYRVISNETIDHMTVRFKKGIIYGVDLLFNYSLALYKDNDPSWLPFDLKNVVINSEDYLESEISDLEGDTPFFFTIYKVEQNIKPTTQDWTWFLVIIIPSLTFIIAIIIIVSKEDYLDFVKSRISSINKSRHNLSLDDILKNENRDKIISIILENPGIHFNELLRKTELSPGNLVWHLDLLETYKIIKKRRFEQYVTYFPYYLKNPLSNLDLKLKKSELTLKILELIDEEPGIYNSLITKKLKINRKTIQYHIHKLLDLGLICFEKEGSKKKIFTNSDSEYIKNKKFYEINHN